MATESPRRKAGAMSTVTNNSEMIWQARGHLAEVRTPEDAQYLAAVGRVVVAHGNLEWTQIMCLKTLDGVEADAALRTYRKSPDWTARKVNRRIATAVNEDRVKLMQGERDHLLALLAQARGLSDRRNDLLHRFYSVHPNGAWQSSGFGSAWEPLPSLQDLASLSAEIVAAQASLNRERFPPGLLLRLATT